MGDSLSYLDNLLGDDVQGVIRMRHGVLYKQRNTVFLISTKR